MGRSEKSQKSSFNEAKNERLSMVNVVSSVLIFSCDGVDGASHSFIFIIVVGEVILF
jgi:hypothetical protein